MITFIAPIYRYYPILVPSLMAQTSEYWNCVLYHDGEWPERLLEYVMASPRWRHIEARHTEKRHNDWGHTLRAKALSEGLPESEFVVHTNADNYYVPIFIEKMLDAFKEETVAVYCDTIHSHHGWKLMASELARSKIDCGCIVWRAEAAIEIGWKHREKDADWSMLNEAIEKYGKESFVHVPKPLFVHN